jgi:hypothetical protein
MQRLTFFTLVLLALCASCFAQSIPSIKGKTLNDSDIILPKPGSTQNLILILGFSHKSGDTCTPWDKRLFADYHSDAQVTYYQLPVLEGAPSFVRPMILRGMRKDIPAEQQTHFIPIFDHEAEWKKLVSFSGPDDAYILLSDPQGRVVWQTHGPFSDPSYDALKSAASKLLATPAPR